MPNTEKNTDYSALLFMVRIRQWPLISVKVLKCFTKALIYFILLRNIELKAIGIFLL